MLDWAWIQNTLKHSEALLERARERRMEKKWTKPKTDGESRWHMRGKIMNMKARLQWEWNMCAWCDNILWNICKQLVAQNWDAGYFETLKRWEPIHQSFSIYGLCLYQIKVNEADHCIFFFICFLYVCFFLRGKTFPPWLKAAETESTDSAPLAHTPGLYEMLVTRSLLLIGLSAMRLVI